MMQGRPKGKKGMMKSPFSNKRMFGEYKCSKCKRKWMSANSWENMAQHCKRCHKKVFAHTQSALQYSYTGTKKEHPQELCEKCITVGDDCRKLNNNGRYFNR